MNNKKSFLIALDKDIVLIKKQKDMINQLVKVGCGQFLNVGNDAYNGNHEIVIDLFDDMIKWANKIKKKIESLRNDPKDEFQDNGYVGFIYSSFEKTFKGSESLVFLDKTDINSFESDHHTLFPNLAKLIQKTLKG